MAEVWGSRSRRPLEGSVCLPQDERGGGAQRGEPQHAGDEQPGDLAGVWHLRGSPPRRPPQHPVLQHSCGLDAHQRHTQPGHVLAAARGEGDPLRDPGPGQGSPPHALGADRLRDAVHLLAQVPEHLPGGAVPPHQLLHQIRPRALRHQHGLAAQRPPAQAAPVPRRPRLWHQQVLRPGASSGGGEPGDREGTPERHEARLESRGEA